jgi:hypothetical protein
MGAGSATLSQNRTCGSLHHPAAVPWPDLRANRITDKIDGFGRLLAAFAPVRSQVKVAVGKQVWKSFAMPVRDGMREGLIAPASASTRVDHHVIASS